MAKEKVSKSSETSAIFMEKIGDVSIRMMLDIRNRKAKTDGDNAFPLCIRFTQNGKREYYRLGERFTENELKAIRLSTGFGEKAVNGKETRFQTKMRLNSAFMQYVSSVRNLSATGKLTLPRIMTALTGKSKESSLIEVWENYIAEKIAIGKAGTAESHQHALNSFVDITRLRKEDGFAVDSDIVRKWGDGMKEKGNSTTTIGIGYRCLRTIINICISEGFMQPKDKIFGTDVRRADKIKIPAGATRKDRYIDRDKMTELYLRLKNRDFDLPLYVQGAKNKPYAIKELSSRERIYRSVAMFLAQYLCCGCNLADLALLEYNDFYYQNGGKAFNFIRKKSEDTANDGEGIEVIVPIIEPLQYIIDEYGNVPMKDGFVFPFLLGEEILLQIRANKNIIVGQLSVDMKTRMKQENHNIGDHMKKIAMSLGWEEKLSGTWARHSFATNLFNLDVPKQYLDDAMGHTMDNRGNITDRYIAAYPIEKRMEFNRMLLNLEEDKSAVIDIATPVLPPSDDPQRAELFSMLDNFSNAELQEAIMRMQNEKLKALQGKK